MTDKGRKRARNEDSVGVIAEHGIAVLADGMGGHQAGDIASQLAVQTICSEIESVLAKNDAGYIVGDEDLHSAIKTANEKIHTDGKLNPDHEGMGSTVVVVALNAGQMICAHVGDSRLYHIRNSSIERVTADHTLAQHYVDQGIMSQTEASSWHGRNMLMRGLGIEESAKADINRINLMAGDILLACSDGLTDVLSDAEIMHIATTPATAEATANKLVAAANKGGGPDNITVVVVLVGSAPSR